MSSPRPASTRSSGSVTSRTTPTGPAVAVATHALAPRGGVDCDGDGITDIDVGGPLVCSISKQADNRIKVPPTTSGGPTVSIGSPPPPVHLAPLIVQLAESIPDYRAVSLTVAGAP